MKKQSKILPLLALVCSLVYGIGLLTFLKPCGPKEDGTFMNCHHAGTALLAAAIVMLAASVVLMLVQNRSFRMILKIVLLACGIVSILIPGHLISLCMMPEMRCRAVMQPGAVVFGVLSILLSVLMILFERKTSVR